MIIAVVMLPLALLVLGLSALALRSEVSEPARSESNREERR